MRAIISVLLICIFTGASAALTTFGTTPNKPVYSPNDDPNDYVQKHAQLIELLQHPYQPGISIFRPEYLDIVNSFDFEQNFEKFKNVDAVKEFVFFYKKGLIGFNELFSIYNKYHRQQAIALFNVFYYAKDWDTFYKTVLWARYNVNAGLFVYAFKVAMVHRKDFGGYQLPAIYEIFPHYFFNFDVIQEAQIYKQRGLNGFTKVDGVYDVYFKTNYSSYDVYGYEDQFVSYFIEDIGLNEYFYNFNIFYPFWMGGEEFGLYKDRRGELYLFFYQQLLARYYMERLSHDKGHIKEFTWWTPIQKFYPNIRTYYGYPFISRDDGHVLYQEYNHYDIDFIAAYENRFLDAIDSGLFFLENGTYFNFSYPGGFDYLGNLIQGNPDSLNYKYYNYMFHVYKTFARYFGKNYEYQSAVYPSVLELPETTLRDPAYWSFLKRVLSFYYKFSEQLYPYSYKELNYEGVRIESVDTDKLITYFEYFDADITNAVDVEYSQDFTTEFKRFGRHSQYKGDDFVLKARQNRLNHVPFNVNIKVASDEPVKAVIRIYLGPKYDEFGREIPLNENRFNFVLLDKFQYDFKSGNNLITRQSYEFANYAKDRTTYFELYKNLMSAKDDKEKFKLESFETYSGFPSRLILPMGKKGGQVYRLFVHISPFVAPQVPQYSTLRDSFDNGIGSGSRYFDSLPFYYPFDRRIDEYQWYTPNMFFYDVKIFHKTE